VASLHDLFDFSSGFSRSAKLVERFHSLAMRSCVKSISVQKIPDKIIAQCQDLVHRHPSIISVEDDFDHKNCKKN
jgi:hypothetical protein